MGTTVEEPHIILQDIIGTSHITAELWFLPCQPETTAQNLQGPLKPSPFSDAPPDLEPLVPQDQVQAYPPGTTSFFLYTKHLHEACVPARWGVACLPLSGWFLCTMSSGFSQGRKPI